MKRSIIRLLIAAQFIATQCFAGGSQPATPAGSNGQIQYNNAGFLGAFTLGGDCSINVGTGALTCTKTNGASFAPSATTDTTNAGNISSGILGSSRGGAGTVNGIMKANGSGLVSAAVSNTDYQAPITLTTTGSSGPATLTGGALNIPQYSGGGSVSVTSSSNDLVVNPSPGTGTFTVGTTNMLNAQGTAASYTVLASDIAKTLTHNRSTSVAVTLAQAGTTGFETGKGYGELNLGAGVVTITPATSTINGASSLALHKGGWAFPISDGTNWNAVGFPGFDTITANALMKFSDSSGAATASGISDNGTTITFGENVTATGTMTLSAINGLTQCLHVNSSGVISGTGSDCGAGGSGVSSLNSLTGALSIAAGSNITVTPSGSTITIAASGSVNSNLGTSVSAANPQISGDATSGIYTPAAGQVGVTISGTGRALWTSTGMTNTGTFTTTGVETNSANGAASTPMLLLNGSMYTGGTATTAMASALIQPSGATGATDWATGGTAFGVNTAASFNGNFIDFHLNGGASLFKVSATGNTTLTAGGAYLWNARSKMSSPADGKILLQNNAATGFTELQGGGTTSSFPEWRVNGATWQARLADNSADTSISAANVTSSGAFISAGTKFTTSGCSISSTTGGATAGQMTSGTTGTCTVTITLPTAPNGWHCAASDRTAKTAVPTTGSTTTSCTIEGSTTTGDVISFLAMAY